MRECFKRPHPLGRQKLSLSGKVGINTEYVHGVPVYQKYLTKLGELIIFEPWRENYHFSQPSLIFLIHGNTMYVFYLSFNV